MPTTRSQTHHRRTVFRFQDLPGEQRNAIYRSLLDDVTLPTKKFDMWDEELPEYHLMATYSSLIRVCRAVSFEARTIFEKEYLPNMPFCFNDLRELYTFADSVGSTALKAADARYVLRSPIGRGVGLGICGTQAIIGRSYRVGLDDLPVEVWGVMEDVLGGNIGDSGKASWRWEGGATVDVEADNDLFSCAIHIPIRRATPKHPRLTSFSQFKVGEDGKTTSMIEGRLRDLRKVKGWNGEDARRLELNMRDWDMAFRGDESEPETRRQQTCFDSLWMAQDRREMYESGVW